MIKVYQIKKRLESLLWTITTKLQATPTTRRRPLHVAFITDTTGITGITGITGEIAITGGTSINSVIELAS